MNDTVNRIVVSIMLFFLWPLLASAVLDSKIGHSSAQVVGLLGTATWMGFLMSVVFWFVVLR